MASPRALIAALGCLALPACQPGSDWRAPKIAEAEHQIRTLTGAPNARFTHVQLTGDATTGQTCGQVITPGSAPRRFIVYIDGTSGPYVEGGHGAWLQDRFDYAWTYDCIKEGYTAG